jgi:LmbE family N-acetylglucosaminyl deacetylase
MPHLAPKLIAMICLPTIHAVLRGVLAAFLVLWLAALPPARAASASFGDFDRDDVLLIVAPHPDDETLCCAGAIERARAAGARVAVVWITSGDGYEVAASLAEHHLFLAAQDLRAFGEMRMREAARAMTILGVAPVERFFLGYPDRGVDKLFDNPLEPPFQSPHTHASAVPYAQALRPGAPYTASNLEQDLRSVCDRVQPTWVLAPTPLDAHADHSATGRFVMRIMSTRGQLGRLRWWIVHAGFLWPWPRGLDTDAALVPPQRAAALAWQDFALLPAERAEKTQAIRCYETQRRLGESFLLSFARRNEIYAAAPSASRTLK